MKINRAKAKPVMVIVTYSDGGIKVMSPENLTVQNPQYEIPIWQTRCKDRR